MSSVILPVPHVPQRQQGECLAACAVMMLTYLGLSINYERLLKLLRIRSDVGAPAFVYLNDPALTNAPIQVPRGDFELAWLAQDESYAVLKRPG